MVTPNNAFPSLSGFYEYFIQSLIRGLSTEIAVNISDQNGTSL